LGEIEKIKKLKKHLQHISNLAKLVKQREVSKIKNEVFEKEVYRKMLKSNE
jgi:hypothetical protein